MNVDFDAPRADPDDDRDEGTEAVANLGARGRSRDADPDDDGAAAASDERDPADEEMSVPVVPMLTDEFRCGRCFLVHHRSRIADRPGTPVCLDCA